MCRACYFRVLKYEVLIEHQKGEGYGIIPVFTKENCNEYEINNKSCRIIISKT